MGIIERKQRAKEHTKDSILKAALKIVKQECWQALSMRKIAEIIEYSAPVIYEHFVSKEALLTELTKRGFQRMASAITAAKYNEDSSKIQLEKMWMAYWDFAFTEKEYYQLMFGVGTQCSPEKLDLRDDENPSALFIQAVKDSLADNAANDDLVRVKFLTIWSMVHGLIAINMVNRGNSTEINQQVLKDAIGAITQN